MTRVRELDVTLDDGRTLHGYDSGKRTRYPVMWHHGTPNVGSPPKPLMTLAKKLGLRWVSFDRPGYGGSSQHSGRTIRSVADDVMALADELELEQFALIGHSGGGPHALACAAAYPDRVTAVVTAGGLAPISAEGLDWFEGMGMTSSSSLRAALDGVDGKRRHEEDNADAEIDFIARDWQALTGVWGWLGTVAAEGVATGSDGLIDDDIAYVTPWGVDLESITAPVLLTHGGADRVVPAAHSRWLAEAISGAELWELHGEGHISSLAADERGAEDALRWLAEKIRATTPR